MFYFRFMRTLNEPLLTTWLKNDFIEASTYKDPAEKVKRFKILLKKLPTINYNTVKRLVSHLRSISNHSDKNLMTNINLAALWGPTIMTVDGQNLGIPSQGLAGFVQSNSESDVCMDLLEHYADIFDVPVEEFERERKISDVLEKIHLQDRGRCCPKSSGDVRMWVYIDAKSSGKCKCLMVRPNMTAKEMIEEIGEGTNGTKALHEVVLQGQLERVIHHTEVILDVTLKWGTWSEQDRRDNYLLFKSFNPFFEESLAHASPPLAAFFGEELKFSSCVDKRSNFWTNIGTFRKQLFRMSNASIVCSKNTSGSDCDTSCKSWPIEEIWWYFGCEQRRQPPHRLNLTFFEKTRSMERTKSQPLFGNVISFEDRDLFVKWVAAMLVAQHDTDIIQKESLIVLK